MRDLIGTADGMAGAAVDTRYHGLDAARAGALLLGVGFHAAFAYVQPHVWVVNDTETSPWIGGGIFVAHMFRMSLFFVLAGFFARLLLEKRGPKAFVMDRVRRIAVPLATFWTPVFAAIIVFLILAALKADPSLAGKPPPPSPPLSAKTFPLTHLWFLYVLLIFYAAALALRGVMAVIDRKGTLRCTVGAMLEGLTKYWLLAPILALPGFVALIQRPSWMYWFGVPTPDVGLFPNAAALAAFGTAFGFGWLLHRRADLLDVLARRWAPSLLAAVAITAWLLWTVGVTLDIKSVPGREKIVFAAAYMLAAWLWVLGLVGAACRFLNGESRVWRWLADASYWTYIVHLPLVLAFQYLALDWPLPASAKLAFVTAASLATAFATYQLLVRKTVVGAILGAKRFKRGDPQ